MEVCSGLAVGVELKATQNEMVRFEVFETGED